MRYLLVSRAICAGTLVALAASGLGGCISTTTYGTGEAPESTLLREATGDLLGLVGRDEKPKIDYEPRAPLVIPPAAQLPEPAPPPAQLAAGAWPTDAPTADTVAYASEGDGTDRSALSTDYVRRMQPLGQVMGRNGRNRGERVRMSEIGAAQSFASDETRGEQYERFETALADADGLGRTERRFLTDPPSQYRQPAETAPAEFEDIDKKEKGNFFSRLFKRR
jgi:hypothetical protein